MCLPAHPFRRRSVDSSRESQRTAIRISYSNLKINNTLRLGNLKKKVRAEQLIQHRRTRTYGPTVGYTTHPSPICALSCLGDSAIQVVVRQQS